MIRCDELTCPCSDEDPSLCMEGVCFEDTFRVVPDGTRCELCPGEFCSSCEQPYICAEQDAQKCIDENADNFRPNRLGTACFQCDRDNCDLCFTTDYCEKCEHGFLFEPITGSCYECPEGCADCDPFTLECFECEDENQKPNVAGDACVDCMVMGCANCNDENVCAVCEDEDFKVSAEGTCVFCPGEFCLQCEVAGECAVYDVCPEATQSPNVAGTDCFECEIDDCEFCSADGECEQCGVPL